MLQQGPTANTVKQKSHARTDVIMLMLQICVPMQLRKPKNLPDMHLARFIICQALHLCPILSGDMAPPSYLPVALSSENKN